MPDDPRIPEPAPTVPSSPQALRRYESGEQPAVVDSDRIRCVDCRGRAGADACPTCYGRGWLSRHEWTELIARRQR